MADFYIPVAIQRAVITVSKGHCEYCLVPEDYSTDFFCFDHIIPVKKMDYLNLIILLGHVVNATVISTIYYKLTVKVLSISDNC
jgi:hypothetical protein